MAGRAAEGGDGAEAEADLEADIGFRDPCMVIWDVESCPLSKDLNLEAKDILPMIRRRLSWWGYSGPILMVAIGRFRSCARCKLTDTGILISQITSGKHSSMPVLSAMLFWIRSNPAPANILLIARDRYYLAIVKSLHQRNYNILRRQQKSCPGKENHFNYCWGWSELIDGERPQSHLKHSEDNDRPSLLGEPIERRDGRDAAASSLVR